MNNDLDTINEKNLEIIKALKAEGASSQILDYTKYMLENCPLQKPKYLFGRKKWAEKRKALDKRIGFHNQYMASRGLQPKTLLEVLQEQKSIEDFASVLYLFASVEGDMLNMYGKSVKKFFDTIGKLQNDFDNLYCRYHKKGRSPFYGCSPFERKGGKI